MRRLTDWIKTRREEQRRRWRHRREALAFGRWIDERQARLRAAGLVA